jgi:hypothetical protein
MKSLSPCQRLPKTSVAFFVRSFAKIVNILPTLFISTLVYHFLPMKRAGITRFLSYFAATGRYRPLPLFLAEDADFGLESDAEAFVHLALDFLDEVERRRQWLRRR